MRSTLQDRLLTRSFWLMDVAPLEALALPVFNPLFGFSSISGPEITLETEMIKEGNWPFPVPVVKSGSLGNITMTRGSLFFDSDFWRWITAATQGDTEALQSKLYGLAAVLSTASAETLSFNNARETVSFSVALGLALGLGVAGIPKVGGPTYRRDMLLIQYFTKAPTNPIATAALAATGIALTTGLATLSSSLALGGATAGRALNLEASGSAQLKTLGMLPAKAWKLRGCVPTRYKVGDFDASASEVSILEMEMAVSGIEEISLAGS
jgi:hypothetical protein